MNSPLFRFATGLVSVIFLSACEGDSNPAGPSASPNVFALRLMGTSSLVEIARPPVLKPEHFTLELWVYIDTFASPFTPVLSTNVDERNTADGYSLKFESGKLYCRVATASNVAAAYWAAYTPPEKRWIHLAATFDGTQGRVFVDGQELAQYPSVGAVWYGEAELWLGLGYHSDFGGFSPLHGMIDEVRIWDRARSSLEIQRTMRTTITEDEPGLIGYWNFDDSTHTDIAIDGSRYSDHGLIWGDATRVRTTPF